MTQAFTPIPNYILDNMHKMKGSVFQVVCVVARQTLGWADDKGNRKEWDMISMTQFEKATGMTRPSVNTALSAALADGWIERKEQGNSFVYQVVKKFNHLDTDTSKEIELPEQPTSKNFLPVEQPTSKEILPEMVKKFNTQKKEINRDDDLATSKPEPSDRDGRWTIAKIEAKGFMYMENNAKALAMKLESEYTDTQLLQAIETTHQAHMKKIATGNRGITAPLAYIASVLAGNQPVAVNGNGNAAPIRKTQSARSKMQVLS